MDRRGVANVERQQRGGGVTGGGAKSGSEERGPGERALHQLDQYARIPAYIPACVN